MKKKEYHSPFPVHHLTIRMVRRIRLTIILLLFACMQVSAGTNFPGKITIELQSAGLDQALAAIEKQTGCRFLYNDDLDLKNVIINLKENNAGVTDVLDKILLGNGISYRVENNRSIALTAISPAIKVTGRVTSPTGEPLPGITVTVKGSTVSTATDVGGAFSIEVPDANAVLVFSSVGFGTQEVTVGNRTAISIKLSSTPTQMEQVVVVGYGTQRKVDVTGAVSHVSGAEISKQASINPVSSLQGKVAGVQITNIGSPGSSPQVRIRGTGTIHGNANPLYVVDGVWFDDISFLNPADIDNVSILKDASSEAIYGIRAANGVVLITTKKGKSGQAVVNYNGFIGIQRVTNQVKMANANEYATMLNEKSLINGGANVIKPEQFGEGTNWYDVILRDALITNHQASVSGGTEKSTYNLSLGYLNQEGIVKNNVYRRLTFRLQNDFQVFKPLKVGYMVTGAGSNSDDINGSIFYQAFVAPPVIPVRYADSSYGDPGDYPTGNFANPQVTMDYYHQKSKNYRLTGNVFADIKFLKNFTFRTSIGGEYGEGEVTSYTPVYNATTVQRNETSTLSISRSDTRNWILENTLNYVKRIGDHNITLLAGQSAQRYKSYKITGTAKSVPTDLLGNVITSEGEASLYLRLGATGTSTSTDEGDLSTVGSYFGRVNYSFKNRYLLNASIRADGSSKLSANDRWGYFPSVGVGWVISDEAFMDNQEIFNSLKLRGSWGKIGNASIPTGISILTVNQEARLASFLGNQLATGASITTMVPRVLAWERGVGTDIGLDASLFNRKLSVEVDYYNKKTVKGIFELPVLGSLGLSASEILGNHGTFQNQGWEFTVGWRNTAGKDFSYNISGNVGINSNKVKETTTGDVPILKGALPLGGFFATRSVLGQPIGQYYGYKVEGIFQNQAEVNGSVRLTGAKPGDFKYADVNKDGVIDSRDRVILGDPNPKYTYGFNTNFVYKQVDLTLDFQGVADVDVYNATLGVRFGNENYTKDFYDNRWHGEGTSNTYPSANLSGNNLIPNEWYVEDGSYIRVRNAQLGFNLPSGLLDKWHMKQLRVYINAQNPLNFFKYRGFSPEVGGTPGNAGIDRDVYPLYATYNFGVNLTF